MTTGLSLVYRVIICMVSIYLAFRFKKLDRASRIISFLIWLGLATETVGYIAAKYYRNNYPVFNIAFYAEFALMALYYNYSLPVLRKRNLGIYVAAAGVLLGILKYPFSATAQNDH